MPSLAEIKDMLSSTPVGGGRGTMNPPMAKRAPLEMPEDMEDQPPMEQIREAKRRRDMGKAYDAATQKKAKGGSVRGGGIEQRGKTRGRFV